MSKYVPTIGLEVHAELATATKMFCGCPNNPDEERPNVNICPVCMGHPGTLPTINKRAVEAVLKIGCAVGGVIADFTEFDRKNYFYPDIPKGYQISQYQYPLATSGVLAGIALTRIHLEEDTATSIHEGSNSKVNFNRAGVPLMELVTEPVIHSAQQAAVFARELQLLLRYLGIGHANMEKGEMRVEANISIAPEGSVTLGTKVEVKNINSFKAVEKAIEYEVARHAELLEKGEVIVQETRGWNEDTNKTFSQRKKENSHDYRYFPDPDLPKLWISQVQEFSHDVISASLPELPEARRARYKSEWGIKDDDVEVLVQNQDSAAYLERVVENFGNDSGKIQLAVNYYVSDYLGLKKKSEGVALSEVVFAELITMVSEGTLSSRGAKDTLKILHERGGSPKVVAEEAGLIQKNDPDALQKIVREIIENNQNVVAEYKSGKTNLFQFFVGQAMKATQGSANPTILKELFEKELS